MVGCLKVVVSVGGGASVVVVGCVVGGAVVVFGVAVLVVVGGGGGVVILLDVVGLVVGAFVVVFFGQAASHSFLISVNVMIKYRKIQCFIVSIGFFVFSIFCGYYFLNRLLLFLKIKFKWFLL